MNIKLINNNLSPLPFYDDLASQNHRKDYAFGQIYPLVVNRNYLIPFQVILTDYVQKVISALLYDVNTGKALDITNSLLEAGLTLIRAIAPSGYYSIIKFPALAPILDLKDEGQYYLEITVAKLSSSTNEILETKTIFSEIFTVVSDLTKYLELEYRNSSDFLVTLDGRGKIDFSNDFKFKCYLPTQLGKPEYVFEEEATERMGYSFIESQISKKVYKFTFLAPEYLCDALRIVRLCDYKKITSLGKEYDLTAFSIEPKWEEQGDLAAVECEFETDTVIATIADYEPVQIGDFNDDFNSDYLK